MTHLSGWVGAGVLAAGISAAALAGAGAANAESHGDSDSGPAKTSSAGSEKSDRAASADQHRGKPRLKRADHPTRSDTPRVRRAVEKSATKQNADTQDGADTRPLRNSPTSQPLQRLTAPRGEIRDQLRRQLAPLRAGVKQSLPSVADIRRPLETISQATKAVSPPDTADAIATTLSLPSPESLVNAVGSAVFNTIGGLIQAVDGPPVVPPSLRDSVEVSSSTLVVSPGNEVPADWYVPTQGDPQRLIYLQHGFMATGPMYSYTASYLADRTKSVVVVTTVTSNPFADGGMWLGGDNMHKAVAQLFLDPNREALNASLTTATLKSGRESVGVPQRFVLVGHSLGGGFAPGVAGYYAEGLVARRADDPDAPNDLAGVVLLDAVPPSGTLPAAMDRLEQLELSNDNDPADYVPVYEIGAPSNLFNSVSTVNDDLSAARQGKFNGVVVDGGTHMDSMLGGNPLIQGVAYLVAGIPQPQNPSGVQWLMAGWINDMFEGNIDPDTGQCLTDCHGIYGAGGETVDIDGDWGDATAVVIDSGSLPGESDGSTLRFDPIDAAFIPRSVLPLWA